MAISAIGTSHSIELDLHSDCADNLLMTELMISSPKSPRLSCSHSSAFLRRKHTTVSSASDELSR